MASFESILEDNIQKIVIKGDITGDQDFPSKSSQVKTIELHMGEVGYINSSGIRAWINWKKKELEDTNIKINIFECPRAFIEQVNILIDMLPSHSEVHSFKVPYYIEESDEIHEILFTKGIDFTGDQVDCKEFIDIDGKEAEVDIDVEDYFLFLKHYS